MMMKRMKGEEQEEDKCELKGLGEKVRRNARLAYGYVDIWVL